MKAENMRASEGTSDTANTIYKPYWWLSIGADGGVLLSMSVRFKFSLSGPPPQAQCMHDCPPQGIITILRASGLGFLNKFRLAIIIAGIHSSHIIKCPDMKADI